MAIFPNAAGFGYAIFKTENELIDCGGVRIRTSKQKVMRQCVTDLLEFHKPASVILRDPDDPSAKSSKQLLSFTKYIQKLSEKKGLNLWFIKRNDIRKVFSVFGARKKGAVARKILEWFPEYSYKEPKARRLGYAEDFHMVEFDAIALGISFHFLNDLSSPSFHE